MTAETNMMERYDEILETLEAWMPCVADLKDKYHPLQDYSPSLTGRDRARLAKVFNALCDASTSLRGAHRDFNDFCKADCVNMP